MKKRNEKTVDNRHNLHITGILNIFPGLCGPTCDFQEGLARWCMNAHSGE